MVTHMVHMLSGLGHLAMGTIPAMEMMTIQLQRYVKIIIQILLLFSTKITYCILFLIYNDQYNLINNIS